MNRVISDLMSQSARPGVVMLLTPSQTVAASPGPQRNIPPLPSFEWSWPQRGRANMPEWQGELPTVDEGHDNSYGQSTQCVCSQTQFWSGHLENMNDKSNIILNRITKTWMYQWFWVCIWLNKIKAEPQSWLALHGNGSCYWYDGFSRSTSKS